MATVHMILQGKGGVGKSFVAATIAQYMLDSGQRVPLCIDTDPVNTTFADYPAFGAERIQLLDGNEIDPRKFDELVELIVAAEPDRHVVIDNGASSFLPLAAYMHGNQLPDVLQSEGHTLYFHCVITGGQEQDDTVNGLRALCQNFPLVPIVVWLNPYHGEFQHKGKGFEDLSLVQKNRERIAAIVRIPKLNPQTAGRDLRDILKARKTFREAAQDASVPFMVRQRLKMVQRALYDNIAPAGVL